MVGGGSGYPIGVRVDGRVVLSGARNTIVG